MIKEGKNVIYENDVFFAVTPDVISQRYQIMIYPKRHVESIFDMTENEIKEFINVTIKVGRHMKKVLPILSFKFKLNEKLQMLKPTKYHIEHIHFHIIPRFKGQDSEPDYTNRIWLSDYEIGEIVNKLRFK